MPWPVYTERLLYHDGVIGSQQYVVPEKMRAVIKSMMVLNYSGAASSVSLLINDRPTAYFPCPANLYVQTFELLLVAYERSVIRVYHEGVELYSNIHGYVFRDDSGRNAAPIAAVQLPAPAPDPPPLPPPR